MARLITVSCVLLLHTLSPPQTLCPLGPRGTLQAVPAPPPPDARVFSFLTFLSFLTSLLLFLFCSGSLLTRPNGRQLNQGLPSLPPREERPLVSPLPSICRHTFLPFRLHRFSSIFFSVLLSHIYNILSLFLFLSCVRAVNWHLFIPESRFFFQIQQQKI